MSARRIRGLITTAVAASFIGAPTPSGSNSTGILQAPQDNLTVDHDIRTKLHLKCIEASKRAEADAAAMIPGRTWTWRLDFERSRQQLAQLRDDFGSLRDCESQFEASLSVEQKRKAQRHIERLAGLWDHLQKDARSLDLELRKGYPTRWHVARDATDMQKEIRNWRRLHDQVFKIVCAQI
jgi:hypothetical protein